MMTRTETNQRYEELLESARQHGQDALTAVLRKLCREDLFFLLTRVCGRKDVDCDWLFDRCQEVQAEPDGYLDLWARDHRKSTIITFGKTIQDILINPEITVGIFSHTKPIARSFLRQIKREFEDNESLKFIFDDILFRSPAKESPSWSEDKGITVRRKNNPKEATIEAHGLIDGQPTGKHFSLLVYDDVVTRESVTTPEMISKVTEAWSLSLNLSSSKDKRIRYIGTRYSYNDTYKEIIARQAAVPRIHAATDDGTAAGRPVFLTQMELDEKLQTQGTYVFACQQLQNPKAEGTQCFFRSQMRFYSTPPNLSDLNIYIVVDPANAKKKRSDYTAAWVIGLGKDKNYYVIDFTRQKLSLPERAKLVFAWHEKYRPLAVAYEQYGIMSDVQHIRYVQDERNYRFEIKEVGGTLGKNERILQLLPLLEAGRVYLPREKRTVVDGREVDLVQVFIDEELEAFPLGAHDDLMDSFARILDEDLGAKFPASIKNDYSGPYVMP